MARASETLRAQVQEWEELKRAAEESVREATVILEALQTALRQMADVQPIPRPSTRGPKGILIPMKNLLRKFRLLTVPQMQKLLLEHYNLDVTRVAIQNNFTKLQKAGEAKREKARKGSRAKFAFRFSETRASNKTGQ